MIRRSWLASSFLNTLKAPPIGSLDRFVDPGGSGREADLQTFLAGRQSEPRGNVGQAHVLQMVAGLAWIAPFGGFAPIYGRLLLRLPAARRM